MSFAPRIFRLGGRCLVTKELYEAALVDSVNYDKSAVINYLVKGKSIAHCGKECRDVFTDEFIALSFAVQTDGEYYWRSDLPYYISQYNLKLPSVFLKKIY